MNFRNLLVLTLFSSSAFVLGQYSIYTAYDTKNLEANSLNFIQISYAFGCADTKSKPFLECQKLSQKFKSDMTEFFHSKVWNKYE